MNTSCQDEEISCLFSNIDNEIEIIVEDEISDIDFSGFEEEFILEEIPTIDDRKDKIR